MENRDHNFTPINIVREERNKGRWDESTDQFRITVSSISILEVSIKVIELDWFSINRKHSGKLICKRQASTLESSCDTFHLPLYVSVAYSREMKGERPVNWWHCIARTASQSFTILFKTATQETPCDKCFVDMKMDHCSFSAKPTPLIPTFFSLHFSQDWNLSRKQVRVIIWDALCLIRFERIA